MPSHRIITCLTLGLVLATSPAPGLSDESAAPTNAPPATVLEETTESQRTLRAYLQLQEQLHGATLAIEQARLESEAAARRNAETLTARLKLIEESITRQRERELQSIQDLNRLVLIAVGVFAGLGLLGLFCTGWLQLRAMNRLAQMGAAQLHAPALGYSGAAAPLLAGDPHWPVQQPGLVPDSRLLGVIDRLEKRLRELENLAHWPAPAAAPAHGGPREPAVQTAPAAPTSIAAPAAGPGDGPSPASLLLGKGQALLHLGQAEKALACFDELLAADPRHADALVKKGTALEQLDRAEEALACYNRAIELNRHFTLAYLQKGGVCNRLERFDEALRCYEQALQTQGPKGA